MKLVIACTVAIWWMTNVPLLAADAKPAPKVGVSIALTGPVSVVGVTLKNAIELARRQHDPEGRVQFIFEDDGFVPKNTVNVVNKFITHDQVSAIITFGASTSLSVAPIAEQNKVPLIGLTVLETLEQDKQYVMRFFSSTESLNGLTAQRVKKIGYKDMAVVATVQDATLKQRDHFLDSKVSSIVLSQEFLPGDLDFRSSVARVKALNPEAVYIIMLPPQGSTYVKQLRRVGYTGQIVASLQLGAPAEISAAEGTLNGAWFVSGDDRSADKFYAEYAAAFPNEKAFSETVYGYDLATLVIKAVLSPNANEYLHNVKNFSGALGTYGSDGRGSFIFGVIAKEIVGSETRYLD